MTNYGEELEIYGVHNSLATDDQDSITYLEGNDLKRLRRDLSRKRHEQVRIDSLMQLKLPEDQEAIDAFYLDGMVAVRVNDTKAFEFFLEPLVQYLPVEPLLTVINIDKTDAIGQVNYDFAKLIDYGFARNNR